MKRIFSIKYLVYVLIVVGILLRIDHYIDNRALWVDEAWRAVDVLGYSFWEFLNGSHFKVPSPVGFVLLTKIVVSILGNNEYTFRLISLLFGISSLFLFTKLLKNIASKGAVPISLGFFVFSGALIYYSAENKQYSSDVFLTLLIYISAFSSQSKERKSFLGELFGLIGAVAVWISFPVVFVLISVAAYDLFCLIFKERRRGFLKVAVKHSYWMLSFISVYFLFLVNKGDISGVTSMWDKAFWPTPLFSPVSLRWLSSSVWNLFKNPAGLTYPLLGIITFFAGIYCVTKRNKFASFVLLSPIIIVLVASAFKLYPFSGRVLLFLSPSIFFFIGEGAGSMIRKNRLSYLACALVLSIMFYHPVVKASAHFGKLSQREEIRPLMQFLKKQQKEGDYLLLTSATQYAYRYYFNYYEFDTSCKIIGITSDRLNNDGVDPFLYVYFPYEGFDGKFYANGGFIPGEINADKFSPRRSVGQRRTWVLLSHYQEDVKEHLTNYLNKTGKKLLELNSTDCSLYLYDLSEP